MSGHSGGGRRGGRGVDIFQQAFERVADDTREAFVLVETRNIHNKSLTLSRGSLYLKRTWHRETMPSLSHAAR